MEKARYDTGCRSKFCNLNTYLLITVARVALYTRHKSSTVQRASFNWLAFLAGSGQPSEGSKYSRSAFFPVARNPLIFIFTFRGGKARSSEAPRPLQ